MTKQFGKYTVSLISKPYMQTGLYQHLFEVCKTGTHERVMTEIISKRKTLDLTHFFEDYYTYVDKRHWNTKGMTKCDWEDMLYDK